MADLNPTAIIYKFKTSWWVFIHQKTHYVFFDTKNLILNNLRLIYFCIKGQILQILKRTSAEHTQGHVPTILIFSYRNARLA